MCIRDSAGLFDELDLDALPEAESIVHRLVPERLPELCKAIEEGQPLAEADRARIIALAREAISSAA